MDQVLVALQPYFDALSAHLTAALAWLGPDYATEATAVGSVSGLVAAWIGWLAYRRERPTPNSAVFAQVHELQKTSLQPLRVHTLPPANLDFVGRAEQLARIKTALKQGGALITAIEGMGGIGKTATGVQVAHALLAEGAFRDGVAFVELDGFSATRTPKTPEAALIELLRPLVGVEARLPEDLGGLQQAWRQAVSGKELLLFLDNARDVAQVQPLLLGEDGCPVLVTSRNRLGLPGLGEIVDLAALPAGEAAALALRLANRRKKDRLNAADATRLAELCGCLPLAIEVTAHALDQSQGLDLGRYLERLADVTKPGDAMAKAKAVLRLSVKALASKLQERWRMLGVFDGDFAADAAAAVWSDSEASDQALAELERRSLVTFDNQGRYQLHDLLRAVALEGLAKKTSQKQQAEMLHAIHYHNILTLANMLYYRGNALAGLKLYDLERRQIDVGQAWAAAQFATGSRVGANAAAGLTASYADHAGGGVLALRMSARKRIAWLKNSVAAYQRLNNRSGEGNALNNLGVAYQDIGETRQAMKCHEDALAIARELGDRVAEGPAQGNLASCYSEVGDTERAIEAYERCRVIAEQNNDRRELSAVTGNLGIAFASRGDVKRAIELYGEQLIIACEIGERKIECNALGNLGNAHARLGNSRFAIQFFDRQLANAREIGDQRGESNALFNSAFELHKLGQRSEAIERMKTASAIYGIIEHPSAKSAREVLAKWTGSAA